MNPSRSLNGPVTVTKVTPTTPNPDRFALEVKSLYLYPLQYAQLEVAKNAKQALGDWLTTHKWDCFATFTFRDQPRTYSGVVLDRIERFFGQLHGDLGSGVGGAFLASEEHKSGAFHAHGLIRWSNDRTSPRFYHAVQEKWETAYGFGRFEVPRHDSAASHYVSKYITKQLSDWRAIGEWQKSNSL